MKKAPFGAFLPDEYPIKQDSSTRPNADTSAYTERGVIPIQVDHHSLPRRKLT